jgi:hypothetical protein
MFALATAGIARITAAKITGTGAASIRIGVPPSHRRHGSAFAAQPSPGGPMMQQPGQQNTFQEQMRERMQERMVKPANRRKTGDMSVVVQTM